MPLLHRVEEEENKARKSPMLVVHLLQRVHQRRLGPGKMVLMLLLGTVLV